MLTAWGYEIDGDSIPPLLTVEAFGQMTGGKYANAVEVSAALNAASQAVRNACGWHVSPSLACTCVIQRVEHGQRVVSIPANAVTEVTGVTELGTALQAGEYEWSRDGSLRRACFKAWPTQWNAVTVSYEAGYAAEAAPDLAEAVRAIAEGVISVAAGVASESADGVSISYSASASSIAAALTEQQRAALGPYRLVRAYAS